jgi:hypothetical protein
LNRLVHPKPQMLELKTCQKQMKSFALSISDFEIF